LFVVHVVLVASSAASSLRQVGGFLREVVVPCAQRLCHPHLNSIIEFREAWLMGAREQSDRVEGNSLPNSNPGHTVWTQTQSDFYFSCSG